MWAVIRKEHGLFVRCFRLVSPKEMMQRSSKLDLNHSMAKSFHWMNYSAIKVRSNFVYLGNQTDLWLLFHLAKIYPLRTISLMSNHSHSCWLNAGMAGTCRNWSALHCIYTTLYILIKAVMYFKSCRKQVWNKIGWRMRLNSNTQMPKNVLRPVDTSFTFPQVSYAIQLLLRQWWNGDFYFYSDCQIQFLAQSLACKSWKVWHILVSGTLFKKKNCQNSFRWFFNWIHLWSNNEHHKLLWSIVKLSCFFFLCSG